MSALIVIALIGSIYWQSIFSTVSAQGNVAVIVVDMQGDFTTWKKGSLAVAGADEEYVAKVKIATEGLAAKGYPVFATQDWHPADHVSFFSNHEGKKPFELIQVENHTQILWPPHCVQNSQNAEILLNPKLFKGIVKKGKDKRYDSYSGFQDDGGVETEMNHLLKASNIHEVIIYGLATDYCVKATAIDALEAGYKVTVIEGLSKGVASDTTAKAYDEMKQKGITVLEEL
ncbi:MAG: isochorismatase family protein [Desulfobulbaceae bacterium]|nr:isochorismatase family protein [Desulfobulbaceae bacterium]